MSSSTHVQGKRRLDRVLSEDYLADIGTRSLADVRALRTDAEQEETTLSYIRRLLQGRIDIIRAELARRSGDGGELVAELPKILGEPRQQGNQRRSGWHGEVEPTHPDSQRRRAEMLALHLEFADITNRSTEELTATLPTYEAEERRQSAQRHSVQRVVDACCAEITRRYREGEANVMDLLPLP